MQTIIKYSHITGQCGVKYYSGSRYFDRLNKAKNKSYEAKNIVLTLQGYIKNLGVLSCTGMLSTVVEKYYC